MNQRVELYMKMYRSVEGEEKPYARIMLYCPDGRALDTKVYFDKFPEDEVDWMNTAKRAIEDMIERWTK